MTILFFQTAVQAGFPSPAMDYIEERIDLNEVLIKNPLSTFIVACEGDSMMPHIPPKARLLVDRSITPKNGDIVLAVVDGEFTVKFLRKSGFECSLVPANKKYRVIHITPEMNMQVWGVVIEIIINANTIKYVCFS